MSPTLDLSDKSQDTPFISSYDTYSGVRPEAKHDVLFPISLDLASTTIE